MKEAVPPNKLELLYPQSYEELRKLAHQKLQGEWSIKTLNTTALVHEAFIKMAAQDKKDFVNEAQFFAIASQAMRRIIVDYARRKKREKRNLGVQHLTLNLDVPAEASTDDIIALDEAINKYHTLSERGANIIELWFFVGFKQHEIAEIMGISEATVRREWRIAKAWLSKTLKQNIL